MMMGSLRRRATIAALSTLFSISYGAVPASNSIQSSILSQQAYNLCVYEGTQATETKSCVSFGSSGMTPSKTTVKATAATVTTTATYIASFLTDYAGVGCAGTVIQTSNSKGAITSTSVGELGQVWVQLGSSVNVLAPTNPPLPPVITSDCSGGSSTNSSAPPQPSSSKSSSRSKASTILLTNSGSSTVQSASSASKTGSTTASTGSSQGDGSSTTSGSSSGVTKSATSSQSSGPSSLSSNSAKSSSSGSQSNTITTRSGTTGPSSTTSQQSTVHSPSSSGGAIIVPPGFPTITSFSAVSTSSFNTIAGVTTNQIYTTRDSSGAEVLALLFFPCLVFCSGGLGVTLVFGVGTVPGLYFPPLLPAILIGADLIPTPDPDASLSLPSQTKPSQTASSTQSSSKSSSASSSASSALPSIHYVLDPDFIDQSWVPATPFDTAAAAAAASSVNADILSQFGSGFSSMSITPTISSTGSSTSGSQVVSSSGTVRSSSQLGTGSSTFSATRPPTTLFTSTKSSTATGSLVSGTSWGPGTFCEGLSPGGGDTCLTIGAGCYIVLPSYNYVPEITCTATQTAKTSSTKIATTSSASATAPSCPFGSPSVSDCQNAIAKIGTGSDFVTVSDPTCYVRGQDWKWCPVVVSDNKQCEIYINYDPGQGNALTPPPQKGSLTNAANQIVSDSKCGAGGGQWESISMTSLKVGVCVKSPGYDCVFS